MGSILATTTATVVLVQRPETATAGVTVGGGVSGGVGGAVLACRLLKPPQGIFGGIGRRVSSLLWGGMGPVIGNDSVSYSHVQTRVSLFRCLNSMFKNEHSRPEILYSLFT